MIVAQKLRKQNISAYIIYMFQVEDIIRAYGLDVDRICNEYLPRFQYTKEQIADQRDKYSAELIINNQLRIEAAKNEIKLCQRRNCEDRTPPTGY